ncbi:putative transcription factor VIP1-like [Capsicum annuum]|nr:putative transcription factor VIP1-like [Capsicum annuum]
MTVSGFYFKDTKKKVFIEVENDLTLVSLVEDLEDGDFLDLYVNQVVNEVEVVEDGVPSGFLCGTVGDQSSNVVDENSNVDENISTVHDINVEGLHEEPTQTDNIDIESGADKLSDLEGAETDLDCSANSQEFNIPVDDDSEVDEELRTLRNERRNYVKQKKPIQNEEIKLGSAGVDRVFEDIERNKVARYSERLGGDEEYINSSEVDSDDSVDGLEPEAVKGVDLPARRKSKKVRFDPDCVVSIFELGMIFENAKQFRKVVAEYAVVYTVRLKLKPSEKHRVRVRCEDKKYISPMALLVLEENKDMARNCTVRFNEQIGYEILDGPYRHIVDIRARTCTCRSWQLRGIPCQHVVLAYQHKGIEPKFYVEKWYNKDIFLKAYGYFLQPIPNMKIWPNTSGVVIDSPKPRPMPGRPGKNRKKGKNKPKKKYGKLSRKGLKISCSTCHQIGHNRTLCKAQDGMGQPGSSSQAASSSRPPSSSRPSSFNQPPSSSRPPSLSQSPRSSRPPSFSQPPSSSMPQNFSQ